MSDDDDVMRMYGQVDDEAVRVRVAVVPACWPGPWWCEVVGDGGGGPDEVRRSVVVKVGEAWWTMSRCWW